MTTPVTEDRFFVLGPSGSVRLPNALMPPLMNNHGNYAGSLGNLCRWLGQQAEALGVEIYPGFACSEVLYREDGSVKGVVAGVFGIAKDGSHKPDYQPGMELHGKYVFIAEGVRGSLAKEIIAQFDLSDGREPQKFGLGMKELWEVRPEAHKPGQVTHTMGWPLGLKTGGGSFMYHFDKNLVSVGFVVHLNYDNPYLYPYAEFQRFKHHPLIEPVLRGGRRVAYGARAITEGGWQSVPKLSFPGGVLIGCSAGVVNVPRIKGSHNAMKTGMLAAEAAAAALAAGRAGDELEDYEKAYENSWVYEDLKRVRNVKPMWSKLGLVGGLDPGRPRYVAESALRLWTGHLEPRQARLCDAQTGGRVQADRLSQARWRDFLRSADQCRLLGHQSRGGRAGASEAQRRRRCRLPSICRAGPSRRSAIVRPAFTR